MCEVTLRGRVAWRSVANMVKQRLLTSAVLFISLLVGFASAQVDDRARELLEGLTPAAGFELTTLDQTTVMTIPPRDGQDEIVTRTRMAVDFVNERAAFITELTEGMSTRLVYQDGNSSMHIAGMPMALPVPADMASVFSDAFEQPSMDLLAQEDLTATYDGVVSYADVLQGHQVTYSGHYDPVGGTENGESSLVFDDAGELIGSATEVDGELMVMVYDAPYDPEQPLATRDMTMYEIVGDSATLFATMTYEDQRINEPLDESLFQ